jgi:hypothetical protein
VLTHPVHHQHPFPYFLCKDALSVEVCEVLERLFSDQADWQHRDGDFYKCFLRECTQEIPRKLLCELTSRMREITGLPLTDDVQVTAQRVMPGQSIGVHSDRPLLGYEFARLVIHLNAGWQPGHGGLLELFERPDTAPAEQLGPRHNVAFGFTLHTNSHHGVTEVTRVRRSVVFNFWHAANSPDLDRAVGALLHNLHFDELPTALDAVMSAAESELPEDTTHRAGVAALALLRWGYPIPIVQAGYAFSTGLAGISGMADEVQSAIRLADWVARLYRDAFELAEWIKLRNALKSVGPFERLQPIWTLCLP